MKKNSGPDVRESLLAGISGIPAVQPGAIGYAPNSRVVRTMAR
jgi:hypothetical protein